MYIIAIFGVNNKTISWLILERVLNQWHWTKTQTDYVYKKVTLSCITIFDNIITIIIIVNY